MTADPEQDPEKRRSPFRDEAWGDEPQELERFRPRSRLVHALQLDRCDRQVLQHRQVGDDLPPLADGSVLPTGPPGRQPGSVVSLTPFGDRFVARQHLGSVPTPKVGRELGLI